ncbi:hypothetical protein JDV02_006726 [Purpureocillium takamizusanense]|uniref:Uncharacterized protein n=1 Tax=Purpureocillium takamizusanense TaxID=2060973 RepID=A0A9Q8VDB4_9HYPO|nr:uncharacterized protein JDV02_006726 [Purpureocillium takamizusanense]UNI20657.1 hypothetical protein JDV02_006726 [Purpureocillium takamizusanense]
MPRLFCTGCEALGRELSIADPRQLALGPGDPNSDQIGAWLQVGSDDDLQYVPRNVRRILRRIALDRQLQRPDDSVSTLPGSVVGVPGLWACQANHSDLVFQPELASLDERKV